MAEGEVHVELIHVRRPPCVYRIHLMSDSI